MAINSSWRHKNGSTTVAVLLVALILKVSESPLKKTPHSSREPSLAAATAAADSGILFHDHERKGRDSDAIPWIL